MIHPLSMSAPHFHVTQRVLCFIVLTAKWSVQAWQNSTVMDEDKKSFYKYHSALMEPWDGPALVSFTDGEYFGATLDRNGLRPCRYYVTKAGKVIGGSEVGVIDLAEEEIVEKGRLQPGKMFLIDFSQGRMISDQEYKKELCSKRPYGEWIKNQEITMDVIKKNAPAPEVIAENNTMPLLRAFGFTVETLEMLIQPMAINSMEGLGSMGNDVPLACLSERCRPIFDYFKQLFAQVKYCMPLP